MNILLVEDETRIADFLSRGLRGEGFSVTLAEEGQTALDYLKENTFDIVILDIMLPDISGQDVCRKMRIRKDFTPVLMLTALDETDDRVAGLNVGADDYLGKPFQFDELIARITALTRRAQNYVSGEDSSNGASNLLAGPISYNRSTLVVKRDDVEVELTEKERDILALFMMNPEKVMSRERILNTVWGANADPLTNVVDVYIGRIRKKLSLSKDELKNIRGIGYRMILE